MWICREIIPKYGFVVRIAMLAATLTAVVGSNCTPPLDTTDDSKMPFKLYKSIECCSFPLEIFKANPNGEWPSEARHLVANDFHRSYKGAHRKGLNISWSADLKNLKGFKVVVKYKDSSYGNICRLLDYSEALQGNQTGANDHDFQLELFPFRKNKELLVVLYTLPYSTNSSSAPDLSIPVDTMICREWTTYIKQKNENNKLVVSFTKGPPKCKIKKYDLMIFEVNSTKAYRRQVVNSTQDNSTTISQTFGVCPGRYHITVAVYEDKNWNVDGKCVCQDIQGRCGDQCLVARSRDFKFTGPPCTSTTPSTSTLMSTPKTPKPEEQQEDSKMIISVSIIGSVVGLVFLGILFYCLKGSIKEKRGIILYTDDHPAHCKAVGQLITYLNKSKCTVQRASNITKGHVSRDQLRINLAIEKADFVLLVYSTALQKRREAWLKEQDYVEFLQEPNSEILTSSLVNGLYNSNKFFVCKFDHVLNSGVNTDYPSMICYSLTKDLRALITQIHEIGMDHDLGISFKANHFNHKFSLLTRTIKDAGIFEHENSDWFHKKYFCPKPVYSLGNNIVEPNDTLWGTCDQSVSTIPFSAIMAQINEDNK